MTFQPVKRTIWDRIEAMWVVSPYAALIAGISVAVGAIIETLRWPWRITVLVAVFAPVLLLVRGVARVAREKAEREGGVSE